jgi:hypothetical protein
MNGKRLTVKRLSELLAEQGFVPNSFTTRTLPPGVISEVYGKDAVSTSRWLRQRGERS